MANYTTPAQKADIADAKATIKDASTQVTHDIRDFAERAGTNVREFLYSKSEQADKIRKTAEDTIVAHPIKSVAGAALAGMFISAILRRL